MKYWMQPKVMNENLKGGLDAGCRPCRRRYKDDRGGSIRRACLQALCRGGRLKPTTAGLRRVQPAWGQVSAEQVWGQAHADVIKNGMKPEQAVDKAFKRAEQISRKFTY